MAGYVHFFVAAVLLFFALIFLLVGLLLRSSADKFAAKARRGQAVVAGYRQREDSQAPFLLVKIPALGDGKSHVCATGKTVRERDFPVGSTLEVIYASGKTLGIETVEVRSLEYPPADKTRLSWIFLGLAGMFLVASIIRLLIK